jgi:hypothetical protein
MIVELDAGQIAILGFVALLLIQVIKLVVAQSGTALNFKVLTWVLYGISTVMAIFFLMPSMPPLPVLAGEPGAIVTSVLNYVGVWVVFIGGIAGTAGLVYDVIAKKIFEVFPVTSEKVALKKANK